MQESDQGKSPTSGKENNNMDKNNNERLIELSAENLFEVCGGTSSEVDELLMAIRRKISENGLALPRVTEHDPASDLQSYIADYLKSQYGIGIDPTALFDTHRRLSDAPIYRDLVTGDTITHREVMVRLTE